MHAHEQKACLGNNQHVLFVWPCLSLIAVGQKENRLGRQEEEHMTEAMARLVVAWWAPKTTLHGCLCLNLPGCTAPSRQLWDQFQAQLCLLHRRLNSPHIFLLSLKLAWHGRQ